MAQLSPRWRARAIKIGLTGAAFALLVLGWKMAPSLSAQRNLTGWVLAGCLVLLLSLRLKRLLRLLPLGSNYRWTQLHIYGGLFALGALLLHSQFSSGAGPFWWLLYLLVWASVLTGVLVILGARWLPRTTRNFESNVLYEKIPQYRALCADRMAALYQQIAENAKSDLVFRQTAGWLFAKVNARQHTLLHILGNRLPFQVAEQRVESIRRYLNQTEQSLLDELLTVYLQKVELDAQESVQWLYRLLLVSHRVLTVSAVLPIVLHVVVAYAYLD